MNIFSWCALVVVALIIIGISMAIICVFLEYFGLSDEFKLWVRSKIIKVKKDD